MEPPFGEVLSSPELEQLQLVGVVRDEDHACGKHLSVDAEVQPMWVAQCSQQRAGCRERLPPAAVSLAPVHEGGVRADRDVVQEQTLAGAADVDPTFRTAECLERRHRITTVETEIASEVIAGPERNADERQVAFDRDLGDGRERAVAACDPDRRAVARGFRRNRGCVLALREHVRADRPLGRSGSQLLGARASPARSRIDQQKPAQNWASIGLSGWQVRPFGSCESGRLRPIMCPMSDRGLHRIEADLEESWLEDWAGVGIAELEAYLAKHAAFLSYLEDAKS